MIFHEYEIREAKSWKFIGDNAEEIIRCIEALNRERDSNDPVPFPDNDDIKQVGRVELTFAFPCSSTKFLEREIVPGFFAYVNESAFDYVRRIRKDSARFGPLYGFQSTHIHYSFIPERIAEVLFNYDWRPHISQMDQEMAGTETALSRAVATGHFIRLK